MNFEYTPEFAREFKKLAKKWRSLGKDFKLAQEFVVTPLYQNVDNFREILFSGKNATILSYTDNYEVIKMRLKCADAGNKDLLRLVLIYVFDGKTAHFIEIFAKNDKSREDERRIQNFIKSLN
jgi:hypothetical protein